MGNNNITKHPLYEKLLKEFHTTKNGNLKLSNFSYGSNVKVWWKCYCTEFDDHEWEATIIDRFGERKRGCPCCCGLKVVLSNCFATTHPEKAKQWHTTKNGNLTPYMVTAGSHKKVWWYCNDTNAKDHEWEATINDRTNIRHNNACPCCSGSKIVLSNCFHTTHFELSKQLHPTKNGTLNALNIGAGSKRKVHWICNNGHEWFVSPMSRTSKSITGCKICSESKGEKAIVRYLEIGSMVYEHQKRYKTCKYKKPLPFDFYLPSENILIEYDGRQHSKSIEYWGGDNGFEIQKMKDAIKTNFAKDNNIPLLRIP